MRSKLSPALQAQQSRRWPQDKMPCVSSSLGTSGDLAPPQQRSRHLFHQSLIFCQAQAQQWLLLMCVQPAFLVEGVTAHPVPFCHQQESSTQLWPDTGQQKASCLGSSNRQLERRNTAESFKDLLLIMSVSTWWVSQGYQTTWSWSCLMRCYESNLVLLQEQSALLTTKPFLQPFILLFLDRISCSPGWPKVPYIAKDNLEFRILPPCLAKLIFLKNRVLL